MEQIIRLRERREMIPRAAVWFHRKWGIPEAAYLESMEEQKDGGVPQWYVAMQDGEIIAGMGVIENDFHDRKDLTPNVCAVYVEERYRNQGIAGRMLACVCEEFHAMGVDTLYLITDHTSFYERYGWEFFCMAQGDGEPDPTRVYVHRRLDSADR